MAAGAWKVFNRAKKAIGNGTMSLSATTFHICLAQSSSNLKTTASARPLIMLGSVTNQVASTTGHPTGGDALAGEVWTAGSTASTLKFDVTDHVFTALGSPILAIKYAIIYATGESAAAQKLLCYSTLTTSPIASLAATNTLTIQMNTSGVLTLS